MKIGDGTTVVSTLPFVEQDLSQYVTEGELSSTISETVSTLSRSIDLVEDEITTHTSKISNLETNVENNTSKISTNTAKIENLKASVNTGTFDPTSDNPAGQKSTAEALEKLDQNLQANIDKKQDILTAGTSILISADKVSLKDEAQGTSIGVAVLTQSEFESQKSAGTLKKDVIYFVLEGGN